MNTVTLYQRGSSGKIAKWTIWRAGSIVFRVWGLLHGRSQRTEWEGHRIGKRSPQEVAAAFMARQIKLKRDAGFVDELRQARMSNRIATREMDFRSIPKSFAPQKPVQELPTTLQSILLLGEDEDDYLIQRKRDGQRHYALVTPDGSARLFSRSNRDVTSNFPRVVRALNDLGLPPCSILDGEIICDKRGADDLRATNEVCRALPMRASFVEGSLPIRYMVFDFLYCDGHELWRDDYGERWQAILDAIPEDGTICIPDTFDNWRKAERTARRDHWEGLVVWDKRCPNVLRMDGKPQRSGCWKWKPLKEGDFIATGWEHGKGKLSNTMGRLIIAEYRNKKLVEIGRCGTGFDYATRDRAMTWTYPLVVTLKYTLQQPDTRALREPVFLRPHPDKKVKELR